MRLSAMIIPFLICFVLSHTVNAQARGRTRIRPNASAVSARQQQLQRVQSEQQQQQQQQQEVEEGGDYDEDSTPEPALQYYTTSQGQDEQRVVLVASDDEYNGLYGKYGHGRTSTPAARSRADFARPVPKSTSIAARSKDIAPKETVQTIRNYSKVNDDGSFTFGYEAADGSFKEETRGTDCVVRGKYGYVDPDGNKREFTYVSGNPCDPNNPDQNEEEPEREEDTNEPENVPINFPRRPLARPVAQRQQQTTTHSPTTVFQNQYTSNTYTDEDIDEEREDENQLLQPHRVSARPQHVPPIDEVTIRQRPRITINTTPVPLYQIQTQTQGTGKAIGITARPNYHREPLPTQPPATTYRPTIQFFTQKVAPISFSKPGQLTVEPNKQSPFAPIQRKPIDFAAEFSKFQQENNVPTTTIPPRTSSNLKTFRPPTTAQKIELPSATPNPIYETQLVFDPATGQIDSSLFPHNVAYRIPATFLSPQQQQFSPSPQIVSLEQLQQHQQLQHQQLQQQQQQPVYQRPLQVPTTRSPLQYPQFSQQVYHKDHENLQVLNSQQLYAQQQQLQHQQLQSDRIEAAKRHSQQNQPNHRFQLGAQPQLRPLQQPGFFYQPSPIDPFLS